MALVIDETFASAIPGGFFTNVTNGTGSFTVSYNSGAQAVNVVHGAGTNNFVILKLNNAPVANEVDVEIDMELIVRGTSDGGPKVGLAFDTSAANGQDTFWAHLGLGGSGDAFTHGVSRSFNFNNWAHTSRIVSTPIGFVTPVNTRRLYRASTKIIGGKRYVRLQVDGVDFSTIADCGVDATTARRPQIMVGDGTFRIHGVKVWDNVSDLTAPSLSAHITPLVATSNGPTVPGESETRLLTNMLVGRRAPGYFTGNGVFEGVVTIQTTTLAGRLVRMFDKNTGLLVDQTWSHPTTGAYRFENFDETRTYFILSHDHLNVWNAVISDELRAS